MQYKNLILFLLLITFSCKKDSVRPEPEIPPKENPPKIELLAPEIPHFEDNSNTSFADLPSVGEDPTVSVEYRLKKKIFYYNPAKATPGAYLVMDYDPNSNIIKESYFDFPNTLLYYHTKEYKDGKLYKKFNYGGEVGKLEIAHYELYEYQNNKLIKRSIKDLGEITLSFVQYEYARNRLIKITYSDSSIFKYFYDSKGRVKQEEHFSPSSDQPTNIFKFKYDNEDRKIRIEFHEVRDKLAYIIDYKYQNDKKLPSETIKLTKEGVFENKHKYSYNEKGFKTEVLYEDASGTNPLERNFYQNGLISEKRTFSQQWNFSISTITQFEYERK